MQGSQGAFTKDNCYLDALRPTFGHYEGGSFSNLMLINVFLHIRPKGHLELRNEACLCNQNPFLGGLFECLFLLVVCIISAAGKWVWVFICMNYFIINFL